MLRKLTQTEAKIIKDIIDFNALHSRDPSLGELAEIQSKSRSAIFQTIRRLQSKDIKYGNDLKVFNEAAKRALAEAEIIGSTHKLIESIHYALKLQDLTNKINIREQSLVILASIVAAHFSKLLEIDAHSNISISLNVGKSSIAPLFSLCYITIPEFLKLIPREVHLQISDLINSIENMTFYESIELIWPSATEFAPEALNNESTVYRRQQGLYLTPRWLARRTLDFALRTYLLVNGISESDLSRLLSGTTNEISLDSRGNIRRLLDNIRLIDPACGMGTFLVEALNMLLELRCSLVKRPIREKYALKIIRTQLFGVDRDQLAVAITTTVLWYEAQRLTNQNADLSEHITQGDSLLGKPFHGTWTSKPSRGSAPDDFNTFDWRKSFPAIDEKHGFDIVVGNPPWERIKLLSREYFEVINPTIATAASKADRKKLIGGYSKEFQREKDERRKYAEAIRKSCIYEYTGSGDLNLYQLFVERSIQICNPRGSIGLLIPSGLSTDKTTSGFFNAIRKGNHLAVFLDFENRKKIFKDIDGRYRFSICILSNSKLETNPEYSFFLHSESDLEDDERRFEIADMTINLINPNTRTLPVVRTRFDLAILHKIHRTVPVLQEDSSNQDNRNDAWNVIYRRVFDMTNDSDKFIRLSEFARGSTFRPDGIIESSGQQYLRVYEGRMIDTYDHRSATCIERVGKFRRPAASMPTSQIEHQSSDHMVLPRYVVEYDLVKERLRSWNHHWMLGFMDIGSATNRRTMIATILPLSAPGNKVPNLFLNGKPSDSAIFLANLNSLVYDYALRQHIGNISLNWYIVRQTPFIPPRLFTRYYIGKTRIDHWISKRVLELTYTSTDLRSWAKDIGYFGEPYKWEDVRRRKIKVELDALFFKLYGLCESEVNHVIESFPILKKEDVKKYGEFKLKNEIMDMWTTLVTKSSIEL